MSGSTVRWKSEDNDLLDSIVGKKIVSVSLGRGEFSLDKKEIEVWTRLIINLDNGFTFEVFNSLDENGFSYDRSKTESNVIKCI